ncbi:MAG: serine hydrolase domain-containing protein [Acidimicrobiales bacterium]|nr:serine hydrolase domain-containing protein [Acidimicrobiales bacterium]
MKVDSDAAGLDERQLARIEEHFVSRYIEPGKIAGCQVAVTRHGALGYFKSFGLMDRERNRPVEDDTIWRLYSMTKPIVGVALMQLYETGEFQLNDPVHRWLPEWKNLKVRGPGGTLVDPDRPMSVKDCLMHTTGLGWGIDPPLTMDKFLPAMTSVRGGRDGTLATMVTNLADKPLEFSPGTQWLYGLSTDICGRLVEVMSGLSLDDYLEQRIFAPLGMVDTGFSVTPGSAGRLAANYIRTGKKELRLLDDPETSSYLAHPKFISGGGGLAGTTADYLRFTQMLVGGGELDGVRILGRKTVELMAQNHLPNNAELASFAAPGGYGETGFDGVGFGLTMAVGLGPVATATIGSAGDFYWGGAASTAFWVDPSEDLTVVFMTQQMPSGTFNFRGQLRTLVYPALL